MSLNINWKQSPNYTTGRNGKKIIAIVNHQTAGQCPGSLSWLCNAAAKASAHYLIYRDGTVYQLVKDSDTAWHAGAVNKPSWKLYDGSNPNHSTIGIEHECYPAVGGDGNLTELQYQATLALHRQLIKAHSIPIDRDHIIGHCQIDSVNRPNCPGSAFPWDRLMKDLKGEGTVPDKTPCKIVIKGIEFPGYLEGGSSHFAEGVKVTDVIKALNNTITWDAKAVTANIK